MSAFIRQCWICHRIINILNNVIKLFAIPPPVCFDLVSDPWAGGVKEPVLLASKLIYLLAYRAQCLLSYTVYVFVFVLFFLYLCIFSIRRWCKITQRFHQLSSDSQCRAGGTGWHLLPKHQTYKHSVRTVSTCQELTSSWHASYFPPSHSRLLVLPPPTIVNLLPISFGANVLILPCVFWSVSQGCPSVHAVGSQ